MTTTTETPSQSEQAWLDYAHEQGIPRFIAEIKDAQRREFFIGGFQSAEALATRSLTPQEIDAAAHALYAEATRTQNTAAAWADVAASERQHYQALVRTVAAALPTPFDSAS